MMDSVLSVIYYIIHKYCCVISLRTDLSQHPSSPSWRCGGRRRSEPDTAGSCTWADQGSAAGPWHSQWMLRQWRSWRRTLRYPAERRTWMGHSTTVTAVNPTTDWSIKLYWWLAEAKSSYNETEHSFSSFHLKMSTFFKCNSKLDNFTFGSNQAFPNMKMKKKRRWKKF